jgi:hypothetical protein
MTKQEKIKNWLIEQGYNYKRDPLVVIDCGGDANTRCKFVFSDYEYNNAIGIFKGTEYIKLPDFQDDLPEPKDKALQESLLRDNWTQSAAVMLADIYDKLLALEAANEKA